MTQYGSQITIYLNDKIHRFDREEDFYDFTLVTDMTNANVMFPLSTMVLSDVHKFLSVRYARVWIEKNMSLHQGTSLSYRKFLKNGKGHTVSERIFNELVHSIETHNKAKQVENYVEQKQKISAGSKDVICYIPNSELVCSDEGKFYVHVRAINSGVNFKHGIIICRHACSNAKTYIDFIHEVLKSKKILMKSTSMETDIVFNSSISDAKTIMSNIFTDTCVKTGEYDE